MTVHREEKTRKRRWICMLLAVSMAFLILYCPSARGEETILFQLSAPQEVAPGEKLELSFSVLGGKGANISTFRIRVKYDCEKLELRGIQPAGETESGEYRSSIHDGSAVILYLSQTGGVSVNDTERAEFFVLNFTVKGDVQDGEESIQAQIDGVGDADLHELATEPTTEAVFHVVTPDYRLQALQPDVGTLEPEFKPQCHEYRMEVPYEVNRILFYAQAYHPDAIVKVNRQTLEKSGTTTLFKITVRSPDGKIHETYEVQVLRGDKTKNVASASQKPTRPTASAKSNSSSSTRKQYGQESQNETESLVMDESAPENSQLAQTDQEPSKLMIQNNSWFLFLIVLVIAVVVTAGIFFLLNRRKRKK